MYNENIKILRKEKKLSQEKLGMLLGMTRDSIASLEGARTKPSYDTIIKLKEIFNCTFDDILK